MAPLRGLGIDDRADAPAHGDVGARQTTSSQQREQQVLHAGWVGQFRERLGLLCLDQPDGNLGRVGDGMVRMALYEAAHIMLGRVTRFSSLKRWALDVAKRRGLKRAKVALARKLATVLHRMWVDGTTFHWGKQAVAVV